MGDELPGVVGLDPADAAQVAEQLASCHEFHDEVEVTGVLGEALELYLSVLAVTTKGWWSMLRIWLSFWTWSICLDLRTSIFLRILAAKNFPVCFCLTSRTRPKVPLLPHKYPPRSSSGSRSR